MARDELISRRASSFGSRAADYAEHRPDYPVDAVRWALEPVTADRPKVLDLAAGTGKLTAVITGLGLEVVAVEPDDAMRGELAVLMPEVTAMAGTAEQIPLPDASVDAVLVGQALHWFDHEKALPEIGRVLRPGGVLAGLWNDDDLSIDWVRNLDRIHSSTDNRQNKRGIDLPVELGPFGELTHGEFRHSQRRTAESLVATASTHSLFLTMAEPERSQTLDAMLAYLKSQPQTADGEFDYPLRTEVLRTIRL
ncbi:class I SAM-dependent methyltransferase [Kutzneria sp. 744]|uniref:class I SAM-dependent methyltransferase n=1 Tax=Kutzneria sp. (strain 744) TaxID=345341 RepID=UPI0003EEC24C|nr:class I SAM-dependent methyltransferase [Kutzneria sp. 744]EWM14508.1 methyltransferase [Kutzneria sp. 744]